MKDEKLSVVEDPISLYTGSYTYGDYLNFTFEETVELIRGKIFRMSPAPSSIHQQISVVFTGQLYNFFENKEWKIYHAPFDVVLPVSNRKDKNKETTVVQPDLCVVCDLEMVDKQCFYGAPELVVEIISPHTSKKDLQNKFDVYEESGVREYWVVFPLDKLVQVWKLEKGRYGKSVFFNQDDILTSNFFPGLEVNLSKVFSE